MCDVFVFEEVTVFVAECTRFVPTRVERKEVFFLV